MYTCMKKDTYASNAYKCSLNLNNGFAVKLKNVLSKIGFNHVWENQNTFSKKCLINAVGNKLAERYTDFWKDSLFNDQNNPNGNKLRTYRKLKKEYKLEFFLLIDLDRYMISNFIKIRISNSYLNIEQGRHRKLPLEKRLCPLCKWEVEDEYHIILL